MLWVHELVPLSEQEARFHTLWLHVEYTWLGVKWRVCGIDKVGTHNYVVCPLYFISA